MTVIKSKIAMPERVRLAYDMVDDISHEDGEIVYLGIGHNTPWSASDTIVETPLESTDYFNGVFRQLIAIKKISYADGSVVIRRADWANGTTYDTFDQSTEMYSYEKTTNANGTITVSATKNIVGTNTTFLLDFSNNSILQIPGDGITLLPARYEVVNVVSNTAMTLNIAITGSVTANTPQRVSNTFPSFAKNFYVRNSYDQVFVCLYNNNGIASNTMPKISVGGELPTDSYVVTTDGYYWKYLYTISGGAKQKFMTSEWMPVILENTVTAAAVAGRIDFIKIINGGVGYNNTAASFSSPILVVSGDGSGANVTAQVDANGTITAIHMLNGGSGYTKATVSANTGLNGTNANLMAVIGPPRGWGSNAALELGASTVMFSMYLADTEGGTIPTIDALSNNLKFRQVVLLKNPLLAANAATANGTNYDLTTAISVSSNAPFAMNDLVYQSPSGAYANATFSGTVVWFDNSTNILHLNNLNGSFTSQSQLYGATSANANPYTAVTAFGITAPTITAFSGDLLYVENRSPITRSPGQSENIKLIVSY